MIRRIPHCSHWGAYTILVEDGRILGVEPFAGDPAPSPVIHSVAEWAKPDRRTLRPMIRQGWLDAREHSDRRARGAERFVAVPWDEALDLVAGEITRVARDHGNASIFAGSYGWTSAGRLHHAPTLLKRMLNLVGGFTGHADTYSTAAGPVILRHVLGSDEACNGLSNTLDTVAGHTDAAASDAHNRELSERRAQAVVAWLVEEGVDAARLQAEGHGESRPVAGNDSAEGRALNRRVEIRDASG